MDSLEELAKTDVTRFGSFKASSPSHERRLAANTAQNEGKPKINMAEETQEDLDSSIPEQNESSKFLVYFFQRKVRNWRIARVVQNVASAASHLVGSTVVRIFFWYCTVSVIIWIAVLMYVSFYYAYMPTMSHVRPVFLHFK